MGPDGMEGEQTVQRRGGLAAYGAVTAAYWAFMLSDGALRMLVLLHFHGLGFSPVELAWLFLLYEVAGIVTNLSAGWIAARFGLARTLYAGLGLQVVALLALARVEPGWAVGASVVYVMLVQGLSGVAKDLAKMSSKSAVKLLAPEAGLFRGVAWLTGTKNAVKGLGFFLGAGLLAGIGFRGAVLGMAAVLALILVAVALRMPAGLPAGRKGAKISGVISRDARINWLSLARVFLFGARDVWFVGFTPEISTSVWIGDPLDQTTGLRSNPQGGRTAGVVWQRFMAEYLEGAPVVDFPDAPNVKGGKKLPDGWGGTSRSSDEDDED